MTGMSKSVHQTCRLMSVLRQYEVQRHKDVSQYYLCRDWTA